MNFGGFIGDFKNRVQSIFSNFKSSEQEIFIDVHEIEKGKKMPIGTISKRKNGLSYKKISENRWVILSSQKGINTQYNSKERIFGTTSTNKRLSDIEGVDGEKEITVYRGIDGNKKEINNGDYVTPSKQLAQDYAGLGNVVQMKVKMKDLLSDDSDFDVNDFETSEFIYSKIEKAKVAAIGTLSQKTGLTKQFDGSWKKESTKKIQTFDDLQEKYLKGNITSDELRKLKQRDNKAGITSAMLLDDLYLNSAQKEAKKNIYDAGFSNFDYFGLKGEMDELFGKKGKMQIQMTMQNEIQLIYENKGVYIERNFQNNYDKELSVDHFKFELDKNLQNKGYGKAVLKSFYNQYKKSKITDIKTFANMNVGGYAWAKYGFQMMDQSAVMDFIENNLVESENSEYKNPRQKAWEMYGENISELVEKFYTKHKDFEPFPMRLIANYHNDFGRNIGKDLLIGTQWDAELNLKDSTSRMIFERYLDDNKVNTDEALNTLKKLPESIDSDAIFKNDYDKADSTYANFIKKLMDRGITNEEEFFKGKEVEDVSVFNIHPTKDSIDRDSVLELLKNDWEDGKYPLAIKSDGKYFIVKGHSKIATDIFLAKNKIKMKVYEIE